MARSAYEFLESEQSEVVKFCQRNHSVSAFIQGLLEHLVNYCNTEGVAFEDIELTTPYVAVDEYVRARITKRRL